MVDTETLSDKIQSHHPDALTIRGSDVKEFIRELITQVKKSTYGYERVGHNFLDMINKLAGDKLI